MSHFRCLLDLANCHNGFTIALWIYIRHQPDSLYYGCILCSSRFDINHVGYNALYVGMNFVKSNNQPVKWAVHMYVPPSQWFHLAVTWQLEAGFKIYIDGVVREEGVNSEIDRASDDPPVADFLYIGI